jgi:hypothetical protein
MTMLRRKQSPAPPAAPAARPVPTARPAATAVPVAIPEKERPEPPAGAQNFILITLDSLRFDSWLAARMKNASRLGEVERRWSYASWTAPSHYNLLMGLVPHVSPPNVYASEYYKEDFLRYNERLNVGGIEFKALLPSIWMPTYLRNALGYTTHAMVSMPVLNRHTAINHDFDTYELMPKHNDMKAMLAKMRFEDRPGFWLLNVGETHYPYALPDEDPSLWPRISGVHGVFKHLDDLVEDGKLRGDAADSGPGEFFDQAKLDELRGRQVRAAEYIDTVLEELFDIVPENTWITITADHGELFGENGYFGHGPISHEKVNEVPFVEGKIR